MEYAQQQDSTFKISDKMLVKEVVDELEGEHQLIVVPEKLRKSIFALAHSSITAAHMGIACTKARVANGFYWPSLAADIQKWCQQCPQCQAVNGPRSNVAPLQQVPAINQPWTKIGMDVVGPLKRTSQGNKYILTLVCLATHYPEAIP